MGDAGDYGERFKAKGGSGVFSTRCVVIRITGFRYDSTAHDLRRSCGERLRNAGVPPLVSEGQIATAGETVIADLAARDAGRTFRVS